MPSIKRDDVVVVVLFFLVTAVGYLVYFKYQENSVEAEYKNALVVDTVQNYNGFMGFSQRHPYSRRGLRYRRSDHWLYLYFR